MKLIMVTQRVGLSNPILAFIPTWIEHLARRLDHLWVVTPRAENLTWSDNVTICPVGRDYERGETFWHALRNFHRVMWRLTKTKHIDGVFTHMLPKYAILSAPYARLHHIPLIMWYTHKSVSWELRLAGLLADKIVTASEGTCRLATTKVTPIGHGIDTQIFRKQLAGPQPNRTHYRILTVGRISPIKHVEVIIEAIDHLVNHYHLDVVLVVVGAPPHDEQSWYMTQLRALVEKYRLKENVMFKGPVPHREISRLYQKSDAFVSASQSGIDKAILEAMACEVPTLTADPVFRPILKDQADFVMYQSGQANDLAGHLYKILTMKKEERKALGHKLRTIVLTSYDVRSLMDKLVQQFESLAHPVSP
jgi:glycosyltransferase involved in cell wall biosynthesis